MVHVATEAQTFALNEPGLFFSLYSPPRTEAAYKAARDRLEEDLMFTSKMVSPSSLSSAKHRVS
jgi:syntaxin-binding protein 1